MSEVQYRGYVAGNGPTPEIWHDAPTIPQMLENPAIGYFINDDFMQFVEATGGWVAGGTNATCVVPADEVGGVIRVGSTGADNDEGYLTSGNNEGGCCKIYTTAPKKLWFEARVRTTSVTDQGLFIGLSEEALAAADTLANDSANLAAKDFVGFHADTAAPTILDAVWRISTAAAQVHKASAQVLVAGTWYKLGFTFDGTILEYYVDGVQVGTDLTVSTATSFPDGEELAVLIGVHDGAGAAKSIDIDWVRLIQER